MKREKPRDLALKTIKRLTGKPRPGGGYLDDLFESRPYLDQRDRAFISQLVQGVVRWRLRLDWIIGRFADLPVSKIDPHVLNILRLALFQIFFLDRVPESAAVNEAVNQARGHKKTAHTGSFVNAILRNICRQKDGISFPDRDKNRVEFLSTCYSYPEWIVKKWIRELGPESTEALLDSQNRFPGLNIRANSLKITRDALLARLREEGVEGEPLPYAPEGLLLKGFRGRVDALSAFGKGLFQVQDEAAQITSHLLGPRPGELVLDVCAGLGGKSTHMAGLMEGKGRVISLDINSRRLVNLDHTARRLGIDIIGPVAANAEKDPARLFRRTFDRIMVDAPCSGLGVISRHPDGKWNRTEKDIRRLARVQKRMLENAAGLLRPGGSMLYVTCTISREENEDVVTAFLEGRKDIRLEDLKEHVPAWGRDLINEHGFFKTLPHVHHMDGFFAALFHRQHE